MSAQNFSTSNRSLRALLGNGIAYQVPRFQRDYAWGQREWEDLWDDVHMAVGPAGEPALYMGYLVLKGASERRFEVIDGQQRLLTLSLFVLAGMNIIRDLAARGIERERNLRRVDQLGSNYVGYVDPVSLVAQPKLTLNHRDNGYYQTYLVTQRQAPQRGFAPSTLAMRQALAFFTARLATVVAAASDPGMAVAEFIETFCDRLFFTVIHVADELNAYRVFETLNARGVQLSSTDLLKNYFFSVLADSGPEAAALEQRWDTMVQRLGGEAFPEFARAHWNSREPYARHSELFKVVRQRVRTREEVFARLAAMEDDVDTYLALTAPEASDWPSAWQRHAQALRLFAVSQPFALLLAARRRLPDAAFGTLLAAAEAIAVRYNIIGQQSTGEQERVFGRIAEQLARATAPSLDAVLDGLRQVYPEDRAFREAFRARAIVTRGGRQARIVRYLFGRLERQAGGHAVDVDAADISLEHVLPQEPHAGWDAFAERDRDAFTYRLGNMALLSASANRRVANLDFAAKRPALADSAFVLTAEIAAKNETWDADRIERRQQRLAKLAAQTWRIGQLTSSSS